MENHPTRRTVVRGISLGAAVASGLVATTSRAFASDHVGLSVGADQLRGYWQAVAKGGRPERGLVRGRISGTDSRELAFGAVVIGVVSGKQRSLNSLLADDGLLEEVKVTYIRDGAVFRLAVATDVAPWQIDGFEGETVDVHVTVSADGERLASARDTVLLPAVQGARE